MYKKIIKYRLEVIKFAEEFSIVSASKFYNISRPTISKWCKLYKEFGEEGLKNKSRKNQKFKNKITEEILAKINELYQHDPGISAKKVKESLNLSYSERTIRNKLANFRERELSNKQKSKKADNLILLGIRRDFSQNYLYLNTVCHLLLIKDYATDFLWLGLVKSLDSEVVSQFLNVFLKKNRYDRELTVELTDISVLDEIEKDSDLKKVKFIPCKDKYKFYNILKSLRSINSKYFKVDSESLNSHYISNQKELISNLLLRTIIVNLSKIKKRETLSRCLPFVEENMFSDKRFLTNTIRSSCKTLSSTLKHYSLFNKNEKIKSDLRDSLTLLILSYCTHFNETELIEYYTFIAEVDFHKGDYDLSREFYLKAQKIAINRKFTNKLLKISYKIAVMETLTGRYFIAYKTLSSAIKLAKEVNNFEFLCLLYYSTAVNFYLRNDYFSAIDYFQSTLLILKKQEIKFDKKIIFFALSATYTNSGNREEAINYFNKGYNSFTNEDEFITSSVAREIMEKFIDSFGRLDLFREKLADKIIQVQIFESSSYDSTSILSFYSNISKFYSLKKNLEKAIYYSQEGLKQARKINNRFFISSFLFDLANISLLSRKISEALKYLRKSQKINEENNFTILQAKILNTLGVLYMNSNSLKKSETYFNEALKKMNEIGENHLKLITIANLAYIAVDKKDYVKLTQHYEFLRGLSIQNSNIFFLGISFELEGKLFNESKDYEYAHECYLKALKVLKRSIAIDAPLFTYSLLFENLKDQGDSVKFEKFLREANDYAQKTGQNELFKQIVQELGKDIIDISFPA